MSDDPEKEECEHNRPFWECEICGNTRITKKIWTSRELDNKFAELEQKEKHMNINLATHEHIDLIRQISELEKKLQGVIDDPVIIDLQEEERKIKQRIGKLEEYQEITGKQVNIHKQELSELKSMLTKFFKKMLHYSQIAEFPMDQLHTNLRDFYKYILKQLDGSESVDKNKITRDKLNEQRDEFLKDIEWMRQVYENDYAWKNMSSMVWIKWLKKWEKRLEKDV